jgi:hypothetical protein
MSTTQLNEAIQCFIQFRGSQSSKASLFGEP